MKKYLSFLLIITSLLNAGCMKTQFTGNTEGTGLNTRAKTTVSAIAGTGDLSDPNIKYFGRWDFSNSANYVSYWGGAYLRINFGGTTVKVKTGNTASFYAKIDGGPWVSFINKGGLIDLTSVPLAPGTHSLTFAEGQDYNYEFDFQGLVLDPGATTSAPPALSTLIEWIGDSITAGYMDSQADVSDYAWACSEALQSEHVQIAYPGITLVSGYAGGVGMDQQYFKLRSNYQQPSPENWDFSRYTPDMVVINLGTNDNGYNIPDTAIQSHYINFLTAIRNKYPNAELFVLRTFLGLKAVPTAAAVTARNMAGDTKVHYVDTQGWIIQGTADYKPDNLHPSDSGQKKVAAQLQPILAQYLSGNPPIANGSYKIIGRNSGLALAAKDGAVTNGTPIEQESYSSAASQQWYISSIGIGQYTITGVQSGRSLDVTGQLTADGTPVELWDVNGGNNQKWTITPLTGGYYVISSVQSGKTLDVNAQSTIPGALIDIYPYNGQANQQWLIQKP